MNPQARHDNLLIEEVADEFVVYDLTTSKAHLLNRTAALVWQHCDGHTSIQQIATRLHQQASLPNDEEIVWLALDRLQRAGLLQHAPTGTTLPPIVSRRTVIQRLGLAGKLAILLPVVQTTNAPTADTVASRRNRCEPSRDLIDSCAACKTREICQKCCNDSLKICLREAGDNGDAKNSCAEDWTLCDVYCINTLPTTTTTTTRKTS